MNRVDIRVGAIAVGYAKTWAYPDGSPTDYYRIPTYGVKVSARLSGKLVSRDFEAFRFGVQRKGTIGPRVVGLADRQTHIIKTWIPTYSVHSARSTEQGAWQVYDNFLIHDGPDNPHVQAYASIGCVEICNGPRGFDEFNDYIIALAEPSATGRDNQLAEIGRSGKLLVIYDAAKRPPLVRW